MSHPILEYIVRDNFDVFVAVAITTMLLLLSTDRPEKYNFFSLVLSIYVRPLMDILKTIIVVDHFLSTQTLPPFPTSASVTVNKLDMGTWGTKEHT